MSYVRKICKEILVLDTGEETVLVDYEKHEPLDVRSMVERIWGDLQMGEEIEAKKMFRTYLDLVVVQGFDGGRVKGFKAAIMGIESMIEYFGGNGCMRKEIVDLGAVRLWRENIRSQLTALSAANEFARIFEDHLNKLEATPMDESPSLLGCNSKI
jgi:hypothetical protein